MTDILELPEPILCPLCGSAVVYTTNDALYGRQMGDWPYIYLCTNSQCQASVGVHAGTEIPLGTMADSATRQARQLAHSAFDLLWNEGKMSRTEAYAWLSYSLSLPPEQCHIGQMDIATCNRVIALCMMISLRV